jgi:hypothetical protein
MPVTIVLAQAYLFPPMNAVELGLAILLLTYILTHRRPSYSFY